ncbi:hypothetical protein GTCCBUS3UF5_12760 [Geobacillus thermoleovorans CCB_US3_UF5]|uniref:Uncharacterized protein n=1 Tax=Geobacillus thermoleovorans CCB_US3_UF5 TaxID=1111068 RepID=A0ABM5MG40_GEOTH|nr:hypothetical protein GTCCBUS3UF5_12760 [Geobacillus thermoleovorans CCB_US3_UF5]EPR28057.1 hypothetical protein I656_02311 [Geobacillus sp. WSUCF1]
MRSRVAIFTKWHLHYPSYHERKENEKERDSKEANKKGDPDCAESPLFAF